MISKIANHLEKIAVTGSDIAQGLEGLSNAKKLLKHKVKDTTKKIKKHGVKKVVKTKAKKALKDFRKKTPKEKVKSVAKFIVMNYPYSLHLT